MTDNTFSGIHSVGVYWGLMPTGWKIWFFGDGTRLPTLKAVVDDFGNLVVVP
jgi:hypothetical protein